MLSFEQFLTDTARRGEAVNTLFEERLFHLAGILQRITTALNEAQIPHEVVGGLAVLIHVEEANPEFATLTRDVDLMVRRADLPRIQQAAARAGFAFRHVAGVDMLLPAGAASATNAVHLLFSEEKVRPHDPVRKRIHGQEVMVVPVPDLLRMKLTSNRDKDRVHVRALDAAGLITPEVESTLPTPLLDRLAHIRSTE
jgi:hypothetical protein